MMMLRLLLLMFTMFCAFVSAQAAQKIDFSNESYSNVRLIIGENDLVGWRIQIIKSESQAFVLVQGFEGVPMVPCLAEAKLASNGLLKFNLPVSCAVSGRFEGMINGDSIVGKFSNGITGPNGETVMTLDKINKSK